MTPEYNPNDHEQIREAYRKADGPDRTPNHSQDSGVPTHLVIIGCLLMMAIVAIVTRCS